MGTGWWRLVENSSYTSTAEYVFEDKQTIEEKEEANTPEKLISQIKEHFEFDKNLVDVQFNPILTPTGTNKEQRFNISSVPALLDTIGTIFSTVYVCHLNIVRRSLTPVVYAKYNIHAQSPLNIAHTINLTDLNEIDFITGEIVQANQLYPNTVTKVQLVEIHTATNASITNLRARLNPNVTESVIKIGYMLSIEMCNGEDYRLTRDDMEAKLQLVDFVHFTYIPGLPYYASYKFGLERIVAQVTRLFDSCKRRMGNIFSRVAVGFETGFPDTLESREDDYVSLVLFWKEMNAWAMARNTTVIMNGAFDSAYDTDDDAIYGHMGWWKVSESPGSDTELIIEEKRNVAIERYRRTTTSDNFVQQAGGLIVPISISISVVMVALTVISILVYKFKSKGTSNYTRIRYASQLEIKNDEILMLPEIAFNPESSTLIGTGNFGAVFKCYISQLHCEVAVKIASSGNQMDESDKTNATTNLLSEINIMSHVGRHENILRILGVSQEGCLFLVTEYCEHGSLLSYLRSKSFNDTIPSTYQLLQFCMEIANGMDYLGKKNVIHGDLSARNVLLDGSMSCKISDFGLSRKLELYEKYMKKGDEPLPWRWMALESLMKMEFSFKSDVWSIGVTFWEVFTMGKIPFPGMTWNEEVCKMLSDGIRLERPALSNDQVFEMMLSCWQIESHLRPTAAEIGQGLIELRRNEYDKI